MTAQLDHLVVLADTLAQGTAWCDATLGISPGPGGQHPLFGTHNRLLAIAGERFVRAYLEVIAIDPDAGDPGRARWFDIDDERLRGEVRAHGPRLIHWVARVPDLAQAAAALAAQDIDCGERLQASRMTPSGLLEWQIVVRPDGRRPFDGCLPTLIQWGAAHPADGMPASGLSLRALRLQHPDAARLQSALTRIGLQGVSVQAAATPELRAELLTPRGLVSI
ncbi:MAG: Riboflavin-specific deaminase [Burkholderiaceae bacterium]|jgi:fermentation-respiration switch protein FrsA (DUF1100 family)|nr:MAG: Riboflavin-specific deaminase [Burkholderiaceae bacterium]